jgi:adenylosuccinate lyase
MIDRYCQPEMKDLWSEESKCTYWAQVEGAHLQCLIDRNQAPAEALVEFQSALKQKTNADFLKKEQETGHDVIAFISEIANSMPQHGHFLHKGLTSSDVLDTAMALRIQKALDLVLKSSSEVLAALKEQSLKYIKTICIGRTHGVHAEPMSFGQVLASYFAEFERAHFQLQQSKELFIFGKLSGAVGTYSQMPPDFESDVLAKLKLQPEPIATQIIPRDKVTTLAQSLLSVSNAVERFAINFRHWARTEVGEVLEPFGKKQKGSSAMPHKKNPILSENLCGLSRVVRGLFHMLSENSALWHERDISHSSVERIALPDLFATVDFMLVRTCGLIKNMQVNKEAMLANLWMTGGLWASQSVLTALVESGMNREQAYELTQSIALSISTKVSTKQVQDKEFLNALLAHDEIKKNISKETLVSLFDPSRYLKSVDVVFKRVFGDGYDSNRK